MGLAGTIQRVAQTAMKATGDIPKRAYVQRLAAPDYDPVAGKPSGTVTTYLIPRVLKSNFSASELTGEILATDAKLFLARLDLGANVLLPNDTIYIGDKSMTATTDCGGNTTIDGGEKFRVVKLLDGDPADASAIYQIRP